MANKVTAETNNMGGWENEVIIIKKNEEIKFAKQSKEGIAKLICKKIFEEFLV